MNDVNEGEDFKKVRKVVTQVEMKVLPLGVLPSSGELKLGAVTGVELNDDDEDTWIINAKRPGPIPVRASEQHKVIIKEKANAVGMAISRYMLAAALGSDYKSPTDPELTQTLLKLNRELTAQGNNLNQIAYHLNSGKSSPVEGNSLLAMISRSMLQTHKAVRAALSWGKAPEP